MKTSACAGLDFKQHTLRGRRVKNALVDVEEVRRQEVGLLRSAVLLVRRGEPGGAGRCRCVAEHGRPLATELVVRRRRVEDLVQESQVVLVGVVWLEVVHEKVRRRTCKAS